MLWRAVGRCAPSFHYNILLDLLSMVILNKILTNLIPKFVQFANGFLYLSVVRLNHQRERKVLSMDRIQMYERLMDMGVSEETIRVVICINGFTEDTMKKILYATTGFNSFDQLDDEEDY